MTITTHRRKLRAEVALQAHAKAQGYGLAKYRSKPDKKGTIHNI
jgi:hypothetical protein